MSVAGGGGIPECDLESGESERGQTDRNYRERTRSSPVCIVFNAGYAAL